MSFNYVTNRLKAEETVESEIESLNRVCATWGDKLVVEGKEYSSDYILNCVKNGDLPPIPEAKRENFKILTIRRQEDDAIVGFINFYMGYPNESVLWIGDFLMDKAHRQKGYGREAIEGIEKVATDRGFKKLALGVYIKNWVGLRFWHSLGFDKITGVHGDKVYSTEHHAILALEKEIS